MNKLQGLLASALLLLSLSGCGPNPAPSSTSTPISRETPTVTLGQSLKLKSVNGTNSEVEPDDFAGDKGLAELQHFDHLFGEDRRYLGIDLERLLELSGDSSSVTILKFHCRDGYVSEVELEVLKKGEFLLAVSDPQAAPDAFLPFEKMSYLHTEPERLKKKAETLPESSKERAEILKERGHVQTLAKDLKALKNQGPFYPIFKANPGLDREKRWTPPFCVEKVSFWAAPTDKTAALPKGLPDDHPAMRGSVAFGKRCGMCHSINGIGGNVGPELNQPMSVNSYWKEEALRQLLKDPNKVRHNSKMPAFHLKDEVIDDILAYLKWMDEHR